MPMTKGMAIDAQLGSAGCSVGLWQSLHFERETKFRAKTFPGKSAFVYTFKVAPLQEARLAEVVWN
jgi:hypothetical protein